MSTNRYTVLKPTTFDDIALFQPNYAALDNVLATQQGKLDTARKASLIATEGLRGKDAELAASINQERMQGIDNLVDTFATKGVNAGNKQLSEYLRGVEKSEVQGGQSYALKARKAAFEEFETKQKDRIAKGEINKDQYWASVNKRLDDYNLAGGYGEGASFDLTPRQNYIDYDDFANKFLKNVSSDREVDLSQPPKRVSGKLVWINKAGEFIEYDKVMNSLKDAYYKASSETGQLQDRFDYRNQNFDVSKYRGKLANQEVGLKQEVGKLGEALQAIDAAKTPLEKQQLINQYAGKEYIKEDGDFGRKSNAALEQMNRGYQNGVDSLKALQTQLSKNDGGLSQDYQEAYNKAWIADRTTDYAEAKSFYKDLSTRQITSDPDYDHALAKGLIDYENYQKSLTLDFTTEMTGETPQLTDLEDSIKAQDQIIKDSSTKLEQLMKTGGTPELYNKAYKNRATYTNPDNNDFDYEKFASDYGIDVGTAHIIASNLTTYKNLTQNVEHATDIKDRNTKTIMGAVQQKLNLSEEGNKAFEGMLEMMGMDYAKIAQTPNWMDNIEKSLFGNAMLDKKTNKKVLDYLNGLDEKVRYELTQKFVEDVETYGETPTLTLKNISFTQKDFDTYAKSDPTIAASGSKGTYLDKFNTGMSKELTDNPNLIVNFKGANGINLTPQLYQAGLLNESGNIGADVKSYKAKLLPNVTSNNGEITATVSLAWNQGDEKKTKQVQIALQPNQYPAYKTTFYETAYGSVDLEASRKKQSLVVRDDPASLRAIDISAQALGSFELETNRIEWETVPTGSIYVDETSVGKVAIRAWKDGLGNTKREVWQFPATMRDEDIQTSIKQQEYNTEGFVGDRVDGGNYLEKATSRNALGNVLGRILIKQDIQSRQYQKYKK